MRHVPAGVATIMTAATRRPMPCRLVPALALVSTLLASGPMQAKEELMSFVIQSAAFDANGAIPTNYTCEGKDVSPPLAWSGTPSATRSLALIVDDPDAPDPAAPRTTWVHWLLYNIPAASTQLPEAVAPGALPTGTREGRNDWGRTGYGGPCPPIGRHRYFFKLYALDATLPNLQEPNKAALEKAMQGHVLAQATLIGTYQKRK